MVEISFWKSTRASPWKRLHRDSEIWFLAKVTHEVVDGSVTLTAEGTQHTSWTSRRMAGQLEELRSPGRLSQGSFRKHARKKGTGAVSENSFHDPESTGDRNQGPTSYQNNFNIYQRAGPGESFW
jgi:hypothetical protein